MKKKYKAEHTDLDIKNTTPCKVILDKIRGDLDGMDREHAIETLLLVFEIRAFCTPSDLETCLNMLYDLVSADDIVYQSDIKLIKLSLSLLNQEHSVSTMEILGRMIYSIVLDTYLAKQTLPDDIYKQVLKVARNILLNKKESDPYIVVPIIETLLYCEKKHTRPILNQFISSLKKETIISRVAKAALEGKHCHGDDDYPLLI